MNILKKIGNLVHIGVSVVTILLAVILACLLYAGLHQAQPPKDRVGEVQCFGNQCLLLFSDARIPPIIWRQK
ncbi:MAG: hypothetical protein ABSE76_00640 [Minisyncoccia bacterium]